MKVLAISYAKRALESDSREQRRLKEYAQTLEEFTLVVFTHRKDGLPRQYAEGTFQVYGTQARTRFGMLVSAFFISLRLIAPGNEGDWTVSSQDPFESSFIAYVISRLRRTRLHVQIHGDPYGTRSVAALTVIQRIRFAWMAFVLKRANKIRVVSRRVAESVIERGIPADKISILPVSHDVASFLEVGKNRTYAEKETVVFLYVGRFVEGKNIDTIINAFSTMHAQNAHTLLRLVGDGPLTDLLHSLVTKHDLEDAVHFVPWTNAIAEEMERSDVFIFASEHEGYGMVLSEAAAAGLPIITTDVGCVGELLHNQKEVCVVAPKAAALSEAMNTFATSPELRAQYGKAGIAKMESEIAYSNAHKNQWRDSF